MKTEGVPAMGAIFLACSMAFLEWLAWSRTALFVVFGSLVLTFGLLFWLNIQSAMDARRVARHVDQEERRKIKGPKRRRRDDD